MRETGGDEKSSLPQERARRVKADEGRRSTRIALFRNERGDVMLIYRRY